MKAVENLNDVMQSIRGHGVFLLEIGSSTCAPCASLKEKLDVFLRENSDLKGGYISIEEHPEVAAIFDVLSAPTLMLFVDGKKFLSASGHFSLEEFLEKTRRYKEMRAEREADFILFRPQN